MNEQQTLEVIKKHLMTIVPEIDAEKVTPESSMKELGASSLDIVEVVSCSMREMRVRIPRNELQGLKNLGDLARLLASAAANAKASQTQ